MTAIEQTRRLLATAANLERRRHPAAASVYRYRARRTAAAAIMAPAPVPQRTAEQALAELREAW